MKKFIISIIILVIFAVAVFMFGWLEFFVPVDKVGVMISKTGGVNETIITHGNFTWSWERLIPTNSKIRLFSSVPETYTRKIEGSLPSSDIYKNMLEGSPDFSYSFTVDITMNIKEDQLPAFVKRTGGENQEDLDKYLNSEADAISRKVIQHILEESMDDIDYVILASISDSELVSKIQEERDFSDIDFTSIQVNNITLPDITMYNLAKTTYATYQESIEVSLENSFELEGFDAALDYLELERLSKLGRVLADYPQLIDFMAVSNGNLDVVIPSTPSVNDISQ